MIRRLMQYDPDRREQIPRVPLTKAFGLFRPYWRLLAGAVGVVALGAALGIVPPLLIKAVIDDALPHRDGAKLNTLVLLMVVVLVANGLLDLLQTYLTTLVGQRIMLDLRTRLYSRLLSMPVRWFTQTKTGEMMSRLTSDVAGVQAFVTDTFVWLVSDSLTVILSLTVMFILSWPLALLSMMLIPLFILPSRKTGLATYRIRRELQQRLAELSAHLQETLHISGVLLVKSFQTEPRETARFAARARGLRDLEIRSAVLGRGYATVIGLVTGAGPALLYLIGGHRVIAHQLSLGVVVAFATYLGRLYRPTTSLANTHVAVQGSLALVARLFEYLELEPEIRAPEKPVSIGRVEGRVAFNNVYFGYPAGRYDSPGTTPTEPSRWALSGVSFEVEPGQLVALVGPSGAGKTTITYMVPRFYDPQRGSISVDGVDIRSLDPPVLGGHIGIVTQETFLFHATVRENLRYAKPDATDAEIWAACRDANIYQVIDALPDRFDTMVGERGYRLSGGEKQRLAIARAILKDPRILTLDEATSSLDSESERLVQESLARLMRGRTSLVVAHRLSTVLRADLILVLDQGRIVERGTHAVLLAKRGLYASLYQRQFIRQPAPISTSVLD